MKTFTLLLRILLIREVQIIFLSMVLDRDTILEYWRVAEQLEVNRKSYVRLA
jgi:hypothetical protein